MRRLVMIVALAFCPAGTPAETLEFDLPRILGHYDQGAFARLDTLTYVGPEAVTISDMTITYDGSALTGLIECPATYVGYDTLTWGLGLDAYVRRDHDTEYLEYWVLFESIDQSGGFSSRIAPLYRPGFETLRPGDRIVVEQYFVPWGFVDICRPITPSPSGDITAATLRIVVQPLVAVEKSTWGRIKSLYR